MHRETNVISAIFSPSATVAEVILRCGEAAQLSAAFTYIIHHNSQPEISGTHGHYPDSHFRQVIYLLPARKFGKNSLLRSLSVSLSAKLHYTDTGYGHVCTTPPTDELTTILQLIVQQIHHQRTKI